MILKVYNKFDFKYHFVKFEKKIIKAKIYSKKDGFINAPFPGVNELQ